MSKVYYCYEKAYPYYVHFINEAGKDQRLEDNYVQWFKGHPGAIMLNREDYARRLRQIANDHEKLAQWNRGWAR